MLNNNRFVLEPLIYSSLFHFPLTAEEIRRYSPKKAISLVQVKDSLAALEPFVSEKDGLYALTGGKTVKRVPDAVYLSQKREKAMRLVKLWSWLPSVIMIGISGSVAAGNVSQSDDIDFFVITKDKTMFSTRLLLLGSLRLLGMRKRYTKDAICLNMFLSEAAMKFSRERQELYTAREIVQLVPFYSQGNTYETFMQKNAWVFSFLPNAIRHKPFVRKEEHTGWGSRFFLFFLLVSNSLSKKMQILVLQFQQQQYQFEEYMLAFYKPDFRRNVLQEFESILHDFEAKIAREKRLMRRVKHDIDKEKNIFYTA